MSRPKPKYKPRPMSRPKPKYKPRPKLKPMSKPKAKPKPFSLTTIAFYRKFLN
jgi:hypothetical protein